MPVNQYGQTVQDDQNKLGTSGTGIIDAGNAPAASTPTQNAFGAVTPGQISSAGAAPVVPTVQQFAFNPKYAAQSQGLEQLIADRQLEQQNQLFSAQQDYDRQKEQAGVTKQRALDALIAKFATSGMFGSSADAEARGNLEQDYGRFIGDLGLQLGNTQQGIRGKYAQTIRDVNNQRTQMWASQAEDDRQERLANEERAAQAKRDEDAANNARYIADQNRAAAQAAANNRPVINIPGAYNPGVSGGDGGDGGGGGGGGGGAGMSAAYAGIAPSDSLTDIYNQINLLGQQGQIHALSLLYSDPFFQQGFMADMKKTLGRSIYNASSPGQPGYIPSGPTDSGQSFFW